MSRLLPRSKPLDRQSATLAPVQSGAPFGAAVQSSNQVVDNEGETQGRQIRRENYLYHFKI